MGTDALKYIARMPHFSFLPEKEIDRIVKTVQDVQHSAGTLFAKQGDSEIDSIYILHEGSLVLVDERDGSETISGYIKPGEVFGGISILLNGGISLRTVRVEKDCAGYTISKDIFLDLCSRYSDFFEYFLENFSKNIFDPSLSSMIETGQVRHFLSNIEPFSFLPQDELDQIAAELTVVQYPKGTVLFVQGATRIGYLYILQKGSAERFFEQDGNKTMQELLGEGDLYGGISMLLNDGISVRSVKLLEQTYFYLLPKSGSLISASVMNRSQNFLPTYSANGCLKNLMHRSLPKQWFPGLKAFNFSTSMWPVSITPIRFSALLPCLSGMLPKLWPIRISAPCSSNPIKILVPAL